MIQLPPARIISSRWLVDREKRRFRVVLDHISEDGREVWVLATEYEAAGVGYEQTNQHVVWDLVEGSQKLGERVKRCLNDQAARLRAERGEG